MKNAVNTYVKAISIIAMLSVPPCLASVVNSVNFDGLTTNLESVVANPTLTDDREDFSPASSSTTELDSLNLKFNLEINNAISHPNLHTGPSIFDSDFSKYSIFVDPAIIKLSRIVRLTASYENSLRYGYAQYAASLLKTYGFNTVLDVGI